MPPSRSRRDPLSCLSCRVKKLRCDRQKPCGNCASRRLQCEYNGERPATNVSSPAIEGDIDLYAQNIELKARIERLERATFGESLPAVVRQLPTLKQAHTTQAQDETANGAAVDSQWLERIGTHFVEPSSHASESPRVTVHTSNDFMFNAEHLPRMRPILLPNRAVTLECLDLYEVHIDLVHPIVHLPSVRDMVEEVYAQLSVGRHVDPGRMSLILIICACVSLWELHDALQSAPRSGKVPPSEVLASQTLFAVDNAHVSSQSSIEAVQASILLCFHFCHLEGFSPHTRGLHARTVAMARSLGLHRIDVSPTAVGDDSQADIIQAEVGRKVWWHLAATDWLFGLTGGTHEGTYSIQAQHMAVNVPRNLDHEDLSTCNRNFTRPADEPTIMSYYLERLKLAVLCREVMDVLAGSSFGLAPETIPYDKIVALDTKYHGLLVNLPRFFQLNQAGEAKVRCGNASDGTILLVRTTIHLFLHSRLCKLHLPYLLRVKSDPRYAFSRQKCLESARRVFEVREALRGQEPTGAFLAWSRMGGTLIHLFYAAMVLAMDVCLNLQEGGKEQNQVAEVQRAIKLMEEARTSSPFVAKFLDSMMELLRKHQVNLPATGLTSGDRNRNRPLPATPNAVFPVHQTQSIVSNDSVGAGDRMVSCNDGLEDVWQDYLYNGASLDLQSWDALMNDLEMPVE